MARWRDTTCHHPQLRAPAVGEKTVTGGAMKLDAAPERELQWPVHTPMASLCLTCHRIVPSYRVCHGQVRPKPILDGLMPRASSTCYTTRKVCWTPSVPKNEQT